MCHECMNERQLEGKKIRHPTYCTYLTHTRTHRHILYIYINTQSLHGTQHCWWNRLWWWWDFACILLPTNENIYLKKQIVRRTTILQEVWRLDERRHTGVTMRVVGHLVALCILAEDFTIGWCWYWVVLGRLRLCIYLKENRKSAQRELIFISAGGQTMSQTLSVIKRCFLSVGASRR